jgi:hypothetical protein
MLLFGGEVMVWDTQSTRGKFERVQKRVLRSILGFDKGVNDGVLYGEAGESKITTVNGWRAMRYGNRMMNMGEGTLRWKAWKVRSESKKDRWGCYARRLEEKIQGRRKKDKEQTWKELLEEKDGEEWRERMARSRKALEVYREVVERKGEMRGWKWLPGRIRIWWRLFLGGMLVGKRRETGWKRVQCRWCGEEEESMLHVLVECQGEKVRKVRGLVLEDWEREVYVREGPVLTWQGMTEREKVMATVGKGKREFERCGGKGRGYGIQTGNTKEWMGGTGQKRKRKRT